MVSDAAASPSAAPFDAVIFDCDGVLADSEVLALEVEIAALAELGLCYGHEEFCARFMGLNNPAFYAALHEDRMARQGVALPESFSVEHRARMMEAYATRLVAVPGALEAVAACGLPRAVASSSGGAMLALKMQRLGLGPLFGDQVYGGNQVANAKPAPDLFLLAARGLGVAPERCLAIEDTENGVRAARAAGMTVWAFLGGGHIRPGDEARLLAAGAHRAVAVWAEAAEIFREWGRQRASTPLDTADHEI
ncbi:MAG: HAD family hydrolase [Caulobacteraceae bacterium]